MSQASLFAVALYNSETLSDLFVPIAFLLDKIPVRHYVLDLKPLFFRVSTVFLASKVLRKVALVSKSAESCCKVQSYWFNR